MLVCLPFPPDRLLDIPDHFEYVVADATEELVRRGRPGRTCTCPRTASLAGRSR